MEAKRARYSFSIRFNRGGYVRSIPDLIEFLFPTRSDLKKQAYQRIFKAIRHAKNQHSDLTHLADNIIDVKLIRRCTKDLIKAGIIGEDNEGYTFTDELISKLRGMADLIESYMNPKSKDPRKKELKFKAKLSMKAIEHDQADANT
jgi:hypothetical protein